MLSADQNSITITRGDSGYISITPLDPDGTPYFLRTGEYVRFFVCLLPGGKPVIEKRISAQNENGAIDVHLSAEDTELPRSTYVFEAKLYKADGQEIDTFIGGGAVKPKFTVT